MKIEVRMELHKVRKVAWESMLEIFVHPSLLAELHLLYVCFHFEISSSVVNKM